MRTHFLKHCWFSVIIAGLSKEVYLEPTACVGPLWRSTTPL